MIKEMVYQEDRLGNCGIILADGVYRNHQYVVKSLGTHPTAYVCLNPDDSMYLEAEKSNPECGYDDFPVDCHGGLTYFSDVLIVEDRKISGLWIGWDYLHHNDYLGGRYLNTFGFSKKWTTREMIDECKRVIDQIVDYEENEK